MSLLPFEKIKREILIKKDFTTNPNYGCIPEERSIPELISYGCVTINKPQGPTSHQISDYVQKILEIKKAGHPGTLDPNVTGCLPVILQDATKLTHSLLKAGKEYICLMYIHKKVSQSQIHKAMKMFVGKITQLPPIKSAVKRQERQREIYYLEILEIKGQNVLFKVGCEAGTYIRKLCHDIGIALETNAHMAQLIRTKAGPFNDKNWFSLYELKDAYEFYKQGNEKQLRKILLPMEFAVSHLPKIWITDSTINAICHGHNLAIPGISKLHSEIKEEDKVAIFSLKNELIALGNALMTSEEILKKEKGLVVNVHKVIMKPETYPNVS